MPLYRKGNRSSSSSTASPSTKTAARAEVVVSAPAGYKAKFLFDEQALARLGAVGLTWSDAGFTMATGRSPLENRPWSPAPVAPHDDRIVRPGHGGSHGAAPASP